MLKLRGRDSVRERKRDVVRKLSSGPVPGEHWRVGLRVLYSGKLLRVSGPDCRVSGLSIWTILGRGRVGVHELWGRDKFIGGRSRL